MSDEKLNEIDEHTGQIYEWAVEIVRECEPTESIVLSALKLAEQSIDTLHKLSLAIRKASSRNSMVKIPKLLLKDPGYDFVKDSSTHGESDHRVSASVFDATSLFAEYVKRALQVRWRWSEAFESLAPVRQLYRERLLQRCVTSITLRRRQLQYFQDHQKRLEIEKPTVHLPSYEARSKELPKHQIGDDNRSWQAAVLLTDTGTKSTRPSEFQLQSFVLPVADIAPSSAPMSTTASSEGGTLRTDGSFEIPSPPDTHVGEKEKACPYCRLVLPASTFSCQYSQTRACKQLLRMLTGFSLNG